MSNQNKSISIRTCLVCGIKAPKNKMIRIVVSNNEPEIDLIGKQKQRGYYIMPCKECLLKAQENNLLGRKLKSKIDKKFLDKLTQYCK